MSHENPGKNSNPKRDQVLAEARAIVAANGNVRDYACDCDPGGERFIVEWKGQPGPPTCYNIDELRKVQGAPHRGKVET